MAESTYTRTFIQELKVWTARVIPVSILFLGSSLVWNLSIDNKIASLEAKKTTEIEKSVNQRIDEEIKKQLQEKYNQPTESDLNKILAWKDALSKLDGPSSLGRNYVNQEISKQEEDQAKKIVKEEMGQVKSDVISTIAFPVVFAIASIFAAFAVKDILTEVLKKEEKTALRNEIIKALKDRLGIPKEVNESGNSTPKTLWSILDSKVTQHITKLEEENKRLIDENKKEFEKNLCLIEYEVASLALYTEDPKIQHSNLTKHMCRISQALEKLVEVGASNKNQTEVLKSCHDIYFASVTNEIPDLKNCHNTYDRTSITLARAKLVLDEINCPNNEVSILVKSLKEMIAIREDDMNDRKEASEQIDSIKSVYDYS